MQYGIWQTATVVTAANDDATLIDATLISTLGM